MNKLFIPLSLLLLVPATMKIQCMNREHNASVKITPTNFDLPASKAEEISAFIEAKRSADSSQEKLEILEYIRNLHILLQTVGLTEYSKNFIKNAINVLESVINPELSASVFKTVQAAKVNPEKCKQNLDKKTKEKKAALAELEHERAENGKMIAEQNRLEQDRLIAIAALKDQLEKLEAAPSAIDTNLPQKQASLDKQIAAENRNIKALSSASGSDSGSSCTIL